MIEPLTGKAGALTWSYRIVWSDTTRLHPTTDTITKVGHPVQTRLSRLKARFASFYNNLWSKRRPLALRLPRRPRLEGLEDRWRLRTCG